MTDKTATIVIFGATGDLMRRKLFPAFAKMRKDNILNKNSRIVAVGRKDFDDKSYKEFLSDKNKINYGDLNIHYFKGNFSEDSGIKGLKDFLERIESLDSEGRIFYLATSYKFFPIIVEEIKREKLEKQKNKFTRIVFEKPFGNDLSSSNELDEKIHKVFSEEDVFRIDHYLAKETVQNIKVLKFTNPFFDSVLNNKNIESINLTVDEDFGVGDRISYYCDVGAIKDVIQNHLLQVLSLILMDKPMKLDSFSIHAEKVKVLKDIEVLPAENHLLGQYNSFLKELEKSNIKDSKIETFARIILNCKNERWNGVKLALRTGKMLQKKYGQITITFKSVNDSIKNSIENVQNNKIVIDIYPKQDINIIMNTRNVEEPNKVESVKLEFSRECYFGPNTSDEYSILLYDVIMGEKTLFTTSEEVKESWKIIEKIDNIKDKIKLVVYKDNTDPENSKEIT